MFSMRRKNTHNFPRKNPRNLPPRREKTQSTLQHLPKKETMNQATLCFLLKKDSLSLGRKKRKLGKGKYNGFGGNVEENETIEQATIRELYEETGVKAITLEKVAEMNYTFPEENKDWNQTVHIYLVRTWNGEAKETEEMTVEWFPLDKIPYEHMWKNDKHWLPLVLSGKKIKGYVRHTEERLSSIRLEYVDSF